MQWDARKNSGNSGKNIQRHQNILSCAAWVMRLLDCRASGVSHVLPAVDSNWHSVRRMRPDAGVFLSFDRKVFGRDTNASGGAVMDCVFGAGTVDALCQGECPEAGGSLDCGDLCGDAWDICLPDVRVLPGRSADDVL